MTKRNLIIHVINGPNLNMLGIREKEKYGSDSYDSIIEKMANHVARSFNMQSYQDLSSEDRPVANINNFAHIDFMVENGKYQQVSFYAVQSNVEGGLVDYIHSTFHLNDENTEQYFVINPGAYGHTSIALRDALLAVQAKFVEVHLSNIYARESFRHHTYLQDIALGVITGLGMVGYLSALNYIFYHAIS